MREQPACFPTRLKDPDAGLGRQRALLSRPTSPNVVFPVRTTKGCWPGSGRNHGRLLANNMQPVRSNVEDASVDGRTEDLDGNEKLMKY